MQTRSQEVILANMKQSATLTLGIMKSLYLLANLDAMGEAFAVTYTNEEALKLVEGSTMMADRIIEMLSVDMS
jgi:hypothetical protein